MRRMIRLMFRDEQRLDRLKEALGEACLDALVCARPSNVLLLSGYWPVVGTSIAIATASGEVAVIAPRDEMELAERGHGAVYPFSPGSLEDITCARQAVRAPLFRVIQSLGLERARFGYERDAGFEPSSYAAMHHYGDSLGTLLAEVAPHSTTTPIRELLARQHSVKTPMEINRIRRACRIAEEAFSVGIEAMCVDQPESEAAECFQRPLATVGIGMPCDDVEPVARAGGYVACMSGINSARAHGAYARSTARRLADGDLVLTHCNSYADGYWTDITRTYGVGKINERQDAMYSALFEARRAALDAIRPGAAARDVDAAAREALTGHGFGDAFKHSTGHGVGFAAINHNARPRLHPASNETLEEGMVFNVEPGIYIDGYGGMRHCDMVAVTADGYELLTPFHCTPLSIH